MSRECQTHVTCSRVSNVVVLAVTSVTLRPRLPVVRLLCTFLRVARNVLLALRSRTRPFQRFFSQEDYTLEWVVFGWVGRPWEVGFSHT